MSNFFKAIFADWWFPEMDRNGAPIFVKNRCLWSEKVAKILVILLKLHGFAYVYLHRGRSFTKSPSMNDIFKQIVNKPKQLHEVKTSMTRILATFLLHKQRFLTKIGAPFLSISGNHQSVTIALKKFDTEYFFRFSSF